MTYELICPRCDSEFVDTGKEFPYGVLCPECKGPIKGVIWRTPRKPTYGELEKRVIELENQLGAEGDANPKKES